jgi:hypothetical protein
MTVIRILFAAAFVYAICSAAGLLLFRAVGLRLCRQERRFLAFTAGAALVSTMVFALAASHLIYTWILGGMGLLILVAWFLFARQPLLRNGSEYPALPLRWRALFWGPYLIYTVVYLLAAMMPETSPDGTIYHVGLVARYYEHRGFFPLTTEMYAGLSGGIEMLFLVAFALGRHSATAMVHLLFLLTLPFGMIALARRMNAPRAGVVGALLFFISPVVGRDGTCAYIDVATAAVVFSSFYFLEIWRTEEDRRALILAGILAGFAYACKFTGGAAAAYGLVYIVVVCYSRRLNWRLSLRFAFGFSALVCMMAAPWIVKDIIQFHNPFYPLFNSWFPNPFQYPMVEAEWRNNLAHVNGIEPSGIPYQATVGGRLDGILGPVFLLSPLALFSLRSKPGRQFLMALVPLSLPYLGNIGARFLIQPLPFLALALAIGVLGIPRFGSRLCVVIMLLHAVMSWPSFIGRWLPPNQWRIEPGKLRVIMRRTPEKQYLEEHWPEYKPGLLLDRYVPPGDRVFSPGMGQMAYQHREVLGTFDSALGRRAWETLETAFEPVRASTWTRDFSFPPVSARGIRVMTDSTNNIDFCINEMRFFNRDAELLRNPAWRLMASSFPWGVQLALDNSPVSWWTSGRKVEPGTWIAADFGAPADLDRIVIEQIVDQRWTKVHAEAEIGGLWRDLEAHEAGTEHPPRPDLRMEVRDELKAMGIGWVLMPDSTPGAADMKNRAPYWGITEMGEANGYRLWRLD